MQERTLYVMWGSFCTYRIMSHLVNTMHVESQLVAVSMVDGQSDTRKSIGVQSYHSCDVTSIVSSCMSASLIIILDFLLAVSIPFSKDHKVISLR